MRLVLDSNIVVGSYIVPAGAPARIVAAWRSGRFWLIISDWLLAEYEHALNYPRVRRRHGITPEQTARDIATIRELAILVEPADIPRVVPDDPDDDHVIATALAGEVNFIVSGDRHLLDLRDCLGMRILSPAAFITLLDEEP